MIKKSIIVLLYFILISPWIIGCGEKVNELDVVRKEIEEHAYSEASIRLEKIIKKQSKNIEAYCLSAVVYRRLNNPEKLKTTINKLQELGKPAIGKLSEMMKHEPIIADDISKILVLIGEPTVDVLIPLLADSSEKVRESAAQTITEIGVPAVVYLKKALTLPDSLIRSGSAKILGNIGDKTIAEDLVKLVKDENFAVRLESAIALYKLGDKNYANVILDGLKSDSVPIRRSAVIAIRDIVEKPPVKQLISATKDIDVTVRTAAIQALGKTKDPRTITPLINALKSKDSDTRIAAGNALKEIGEPAVLPLLELVKQEQDIAVLQRAIQTLGEIGDKRAIDTLEKIYEESKQPIVKNEAATALNKIE